MKEKKKQQQQKKKHFFNQLILYDMFFFCFCFFLQAVKQVQFNQFKKSLLGSVSDDGGVSLWDCNTRQLINTFPSHRAPATGLSFSPINDILLMSVGLDKRITCQDTQSKK